MECLLPWKLWHQTVHPTKVLLMLNLGTLVLSKDPLDPPCDPLRGLLNPMSPSSQLGIHTMISLYLRMFCRRETHGAPTKEADFGCDLTQQGNPITLVTAPAPAFCQTGHLIEPEAHIHLHLQLIEEVTNPLPTVPSHKDCHKPCTATAHGHPTLLHTDLSHMHRPF